MALRPPWWKLAAAGAVLAFLAGTHWKAYTAGKHKEQVKAVALQLEQTQDLANFNENQRLIERGWQANKTKAENERAIKIRAASPVVASLARELDGLRNDLYTLTTDSSGKPRATSFADAATARNLFEQCVREYSGVAQKADGHALDAQTLLEAWPK